MGRSAAARIRTAAAARAGIRTSGAAIATAAIATAAIATGAVAAGTTHPAAPGATAPPSYGVRIQAVFDRAGNPSLVANFTPAGSLAKPAWAICRPAPATGCVPTGRSVWLDPGPTPAGTVFQATATYLGRTYVARSAPWRGTVRATAAPRVRGRPRYGAAVSAAGARWSGGWGSERDHRSVEACRTRRARHCVNLTAPNGTGFSRRPAIVGAWFTGWYLFAFDQRLAADTLFALPGYGSAASVPPLRAGPAVARSAPAGPIRGPSPPRVRILRAAIVRDGRVLVLRVHCSVRCHVELQVYDRRSGSGARVAVSGSALVGVRRGALRRGRLHISFSVDTGPLLSGTTRLR